MVVDVELCRTPEYGTGPVGYKCQEADEEDAVGGDAIVGVGEVDAGDGVGEREEEE